MTQKFVVRLLDDAGVLLAWTTVYATAQPQGRPHSCPFRATTPTRFVITERGCASRLLIHWCDLDLVRETPLMEGPMEVTPGQEATFHWIEPVWIVPAGGYQGALPTVTVPGPITIGVPTGNLGLVGVHG